jgi:UDP-glucose 4-epimerase
MKVLITGGAGYIGSTIASACIDRGIEPIILDDLYTGKPEFVEGRTFYEGDVADGALIDRIAQEHPDIFGVVHCAALIVVPESVEQPLAYYENNVSKGIALLQHLSRNGIDRVLFSSSASIYEASEDFTVDESSGIHPLSPYANSKALFESILRDTAAAGFVRAIALRYFNPIGADPELRTGLQSPVPSHALGKLITAHRTGETFTVTGVDWNTRDGSGIRDYIHVWDLAAAHVLALENFDTVATKDAPYQVINIGTGEGTTVKELVAAFERVVGSSVAVEYGPARPGDSAGVFTRSARAADELGWKAERSIEDGIRDSLAWAEKYFGTV